MGPCWPGPGPRFTVRLVPTNYFHVHSCLLPRAIIIQRRHLAASPVLPGTMHPKGPCVLGFLRAAPTAATPAVTILMTMNDALGTDHMFSSTLRAASLPVRDGI
jgi:hypothetical protein